MSDRTACSTVIPTQRHGDADHRDQRGAGRPVRRPSRRSGRARGRRRPCASVDPRRCGADVRPMTDRTTDADGGADAGRRSRRPATQGRVSAPAHDAHHARRRGRAAIRPHPGRPSAARARSSPRVGLAVLAAGMVVVPTARCRLSRSRCSGPSTTCPAGCTGGLAAAAARCAGRSDRWSPWSRSSCAASGWPSPPLAVTVLKLGRRAGRQGRSSAGSARARRSVPRSHCAVTCTWPARASSPATPCSSPPWPASSRRTCPGGGGSCPGCWSPPSCSAASTSAPTTRSTSCAARRSGVPSPRSSTSPWRVQTHRAAS